MENYIEPQRAEAAADRLVATRAAEHRSPHPHAGAHLSAAWAVRGTRSNPTSRRRAPTRPISARPARTRSYRYGYYPHNVHFIVTSAQMAGDMTTAIREAQRLAQGPQRRYRRQVRHRAGGHCRALSSPMRRSPRPSEILALPAPNPKLLYATGIWRYARAVAYAERRDRRGFDRELVALRRLRTTGKFDDMVAQAMPAPDLLLLAETAAQRALRIGQRPLRPGCPVLPRGGGGRGSHPLHGAALLVLPDPPVARRRALQGRSATPMRSRRSRKHWSARPRTAGRSTVWR